VVVAAAVGALAVAPAVALQGTVVDDRDRPIFRARVCYERGGAELFCSETDAQGRFELPDSEVELIRVSSRDSYTVTRPAKDALQGPIVLVAAPQLLVRLVRAGTREPIAEGEVLVAYPAGRQVGPFRANASGVRVRRVLDPGEARVVGRAPGFLDSPPHVVTLAGGTVTELTLELEPLPAREGGPDASGEEHP
jgi:hypothetical protein